MNTYLRKFVLQTNYGFNPTEQDGYYDQIINAIDKFQTIGPVTSLEDFHSSKAEWIPDGKSLWTNLTNTKMSDAKVLGVDF